jgi:hypothetical protein
MEALGENLIRELSKGINVKPASLDSQKLLFQLREIKTKDE